MKANNANSVFISGGTGYMGQRLAARLVERGHGVRVLARGGSENKVPPGAEIVRGNALDASTFAAKIRLGDTFVHLTGAARPSPWKEKEFRAIDLPSLAASVAAAKSAGHFVYVSVAHPAPIMKAYIRVRLECEAMLAAAGIKCTILRPWYVLGPGHRWPVVLKPFYKIAEAIPAMRDGARRLGLVTLEEMIRALVWAVEHPPENRREMSVEEIRRVSY